jgi:hypothetical protein
MLVSCPKITANFTVNTGHDCETISSLSPSDTRLGHWLIEYSGRPEWTNSNVPPSGFGDAQDARRALADAKRRMKGAEPEQACFYATSGPRVSVVNGKYITGSESIARSSVQAALNKGPIVKGSTWRGQHPTWPAQHPNTKQDLFLYFDDDGLPSVRIGSSTSVPVFAEAVTIYEKSGATQLKFQNFSFDVFPTLDSKVLRVRFRGKSEALINLRRIR